MSSWPSLRAYAFDSDRVHFLPESRRARRGRARPEWDGRRERVKRRRVLRSGGMSQQHFTENVTSPVLCCEEDESQHARKLI